MVIGKDSNSAEFVFLNIMLFINVYSTHRFFTNSESHAWRNYLAFLIPTAGQRVELRLLDKTSSHYWPQFLSCQLPFQTKFQLLPFFSSFIPSFKPKPRVKLMKSTKYNEEYKDEYVF